MAMIENIRKRRGLLIFFIGIGMVGFLIPYDAVMSLFGRNPGTEVVGEMNGETISSGSLQEELNSVRESGLYRGDDNISSATWTDMSNEAIYRDDIDALGYVIGESEYEDVRYGVSPSTMVKTAYYGGVVTEESRENARNLFEQQPVIAERAQRAMIIKRYKLEKLESLLKKGLYANPLDAERDFLKKSDKSKIDYVAVKYDAISDSTVTVSDSQVMSYFNKNRNNPKYSQTPFREIKLLSYDVVASSADSSAVNSKLIDLKDKFINAENDSLFIIDNTDDRVFVAEIYQEGSLAGANDSLLANGAIGTLVGPYEDGGFYKLSKVIRKKPIVDRVNGRHIFLSSGRSEQAQVYALADSLKTLLDDGASFSSLAEEWSEEEETASKGGSLGWLSLNDEIDQDQKVVNLLRSRLVGAKLNTVSITDVPGGFSIYEATNFEYDGKQSVLAVLSREIEASDDTKDEIYETVSSFSLKYEDGVKMTDAAAEEGKVATEQKIRPSSKSVPSLPNSSEIVNWAYANSTDLNSVSSVFIIGNKYVVATLSNIQDEKTPEFTTVEDAVRADALKQAKYDALKSQMNSGSLEEILAAVDGAEKKTTTCNFNTTNVVGLGANEAEAVGYAFGIEEGAISNPVQGDAGIIVLQVMDVTLAAEKDNYGSDQTTLQTALTNKYSRIRSSLFSTMIKDDRNR